MESVHILHILDKDVKKTLDKLTRHLTGHFQQTTSMCVGGQVSSFCMLEAAAAVSIKECFNPSAAEVLITPPVN